jgi:hypothetical protein
MARSEQRSSQRRRNGGAASSSASISTRWTVTPRVIGAHLVIELGRAVVLPEPTQDAAERGREQRLGGGGVVGAIERVVEVGDVRAA